MTLFRGDGGAVALTGLDWDGDPAGRRAIVFSGAGLLNAYPATYLWKVFPRDQVTGIGDNTRYWTAFFWGNNGEFAWGSGYETSYYGCHPYPTPAPTGTGKWEIAVFASDFVERDNGSSPNVTFDQWYSQALVVSDTGSDLSHRFYINLPSVTTANRITTLVEGFNPVVPPSPCLIWGQAPDNGSGASWGGFSRWEEGNHRIRGVQVYNAALSEAHIVALSDLDTNAEVLSYCSANSITSLWYLNMNWTVADITDKSGNDNDPAWAGSERPVDFTL